MLVLQTSCKGNADLMGMQVLPEAAHTLILSFRAGAAKLMARALLSTVLQILCKQAVVDRQPSTSNSLQRLDCIVLHAPILGLGQAAYVKSNSVAWPCDIHIQCE